MHTCMHVNWTNGCMHVQWHTLTHKPQHMILHMDKYTCMHTETRTCTEAHMHPFVRMHKYMHTHSHACAQAHMHKPQHIILHIDKNTCIMCDTQGWNGYSKKNMLDIFTSQSPAYANNSQESHQSAVLYTLLQSTFVIFLIKKSAKWIWTKLTMCWVPHFCLNQ